MRVNPDGLPTARGEMLRGPHLPEGEGDGPVYILESLPFPMLFLMTSYAHVTNGRLRSMNIDTPAMGPATERATATDSGESTVNPTGPHFAAVVDGATSVAETVFASSFLRHVAWGVTPPPPPKRGRET